MKKPASLCQRLAFWLDGIFYGTIERDYIRAWTKSPRMRAYEKNVNQEIIRDLIKFAKKDQ